MADVLSRIRDARHTMMLAAFERWVNHWEERESKRQLVTAAGAGAADSARRDSAFNTREALRATLAAAAKAFERMVGPTWDATPFAPSPDARRVAAPVARIVEWGGDGFDPVGVATGFLVSPSLLLTNWHVIPRDLYASGLYANFGYETTERGTTRGSLFALDASAFFLAYEYLDFALIGVSPQGSDGSSLSNVGFVRLIDADGKIRTGDPVNIIQHPSGGPRQYAVTNNRLTQILEAEGFLHYETDTLAGSSGSPVFNGHWELVGLHHCGIPAMRGAAILKRDGSEWNPEQDDENDVEWVANEGARVSSILADLKGRHLANGAQQALLDQLLMLTPDPLVTAIAPLAGVVPQLATSPAVATTIPTGGAMVPFNVFNITGGTNTIFAGGAAPEAAPTTAPPSVVVTRAEGDAALAPEKAQNFDPDYSARPGYNDHFLGVAVPMPTVIESRHGELYTVGDYRAFVESRRNVPSLDVDALTDETPILLPYHHFSVVTSKRFRMPMVTASNADYSDEARSDPRPRSAFGDETWRQDPRIPRELQLIDSDIYGPATNLDRGHVVRREDNAWGTPGLATEFANADSYHWTNCTPQHELFNQENPKGAEYKGKKGIWGQFEADLEDEIAAGGGQAVIFAGPVLHDDLPSRDFGHGAVQYPLKFWKVIVVPKTSARRPKLLAYGYVFDQSRAIREFGLGLQLDEALRLNAFSRQARPLATIADLAGVTFDPRLLAVDQHREA